MYLETLQIQKLEAEYNVSEFQDPSLVCYLVSAISIGEMSLLVLFKPPALAGTASGSFVFIGRRRSAHIVANGSWGSN